MQRKDEGTKKQTAFFRVSPSLRLHLPDADAERRSLHFFTNFLRRSGTAWRRPDQAVERALGNARVGSAGVTGPARGSLAAELDRHGVSRAALIASVPGDAASVAEAVRRHPQRFVGFFMVDPTQPDAEAAAAQAIDRDGLRICLFPAMQRYPIHDERGNSSRLLPRGLGPPCSSTAACVSVGVRKKLGLASPFDVRFGNPLDLHAVASSYPSVPIIVPHFGAGLLREALMVADLCSNVLFDTSSSNGWIKYTPGLTLPAVFRQALAVLGPDRLLFGTDSSFFPRGWVKDVHEQQSAALDELV
jgi:predicted TIM-barrel fold metal-dependent hydrolase